jgi:hypothetical protein
MSDAVLAAIIAATATLCASFMQLRVALAREADARSRGQPVSRRRSRLPMILVGIMLLAAAVGGFALSQWLGSTQRSAEADLQRELSERVAELSAAIGRLERLNAAAAGGASAAAAPAAPETVMPSAMPVAASAPGPTPAPGEAAAAAPAAAAEIPAVAAAAQLVPPAAPTPLADARPVLAQGSAPARSP